MKVLDARAEYSSVQDYYRVEVYYSVLDLVIQQMKHRFEEKDLDLLQSVEKAVVKQDQQSVAKVCEVYGLDPDDLEAELRLFHNQFTTTAAKTDKESIKSPVTMQSIISQYRSKPFQILITLRALLKIYISIACNSAGAERSFSCLRRLKTYLRKTMGQDRLNHLAILAIEVDTKVDFSLITEKFALSNRRLNMK